MTTPNDASFTFDLCGGYPAVDFANTVSSRHTASPVERLTGYSALLDFCAQSGLLEGDDVTRLRAWAAAHPDEAGAILTRSIALREALYEIFTALAADQAPPPTALEVLNRAWQSMRLGPTLSWQWAAGPEAPDAMLGKILTSAVDLLSSPRRERVRTCGADDCLWLFLDTSKNGSRRWCDMNQCGNRTKARRFYQRRREASDDA